MGRTTGAGMAIHLGRSLPNASRDRPERRRERPARRRRHCRRPPAAPTWSCSRWGFPCRRRCRQRGALLPHHFTLAARRFVISEPVGARRCVSVALSLGSPPPGVTRHRASVEPGLSSPRDMQRAAIRPSGMGSCGKPRPRLKGAGEPSGLVIPAQAGIQGQSLSRRPWTPAFAGVTAFKARGTGSGRRGIR